jgi:hypothetical protein
MERRKSISIISILLLILMGFSQCEKAAETVVENEVVKRMTARNWVVEYFEESSVDVTAEFSPYEFEFTKEKKVYGITPSDRTQGIWDGMIDITAQKATITSNFSTGSTTLKRLNGTWNITSATETTVQAYLNEGGRNATMKLRGK